MNTREHRLMYVVLAPLMTLVVGASPLPGQTRAGDYGDRLEILVERLEKEREAGHIPGMALAVVSADEVLLTHCFGMADLEQAIPVTPETLFAIGSATKSFTATLAAMLVDEGRMSWDDPVTKHLPWFELAIDGADENTEATLRDLLCHRTGFTRMGVLWGAGNTSRETVLRTATRAEPWAPFRARFLYCNVTFMAAGEAAGAASGMGWDEAVRKRLLEPLGMTNAVLSIAEAKENPHLARGYVWDDEAEEIMHLEMRELDSIAPAGAINADVRDMARWVRFLLGRGALDGTRLVPATRILETWEPQIRMGGEVSYALGWMVREWNGQRVIDHGGNIDGFAAEVAVLPDSDLGFVLLTNTTISSLQSAAPAIVWETLLGEEKSGESGPTEDFTPYLGEYRADFGAFDEGVFEVLAQGDGLALRIPGQGVIGLRAPDESGRRVSLVRDSLAVSFETNAAGESTWMILHDGPANIDLPRIGVAMDPEVPLSELQRFLGTYRDEKRDVDIDVIVSFNRLALAVPGEMVYYLHPPDGEGRWAFRFIAGRAVEFDEGSEGHIASLTLHERGTSRPCLRQVEEARGEMVSMEEVLALLDLEKRGRRLQGAGTFRLTGTIRHTHAGVTGTTVVTARGMDLLHGRIDLGPFGTEERAVQGERCWTAPIARPLDVPQGRRLTQARLDHPGVLLGDWRRSYDGLELHGTEAFGEGEVHVLVLRKGELPPTRFFVDCETGDLRRVETTRLTMSGLEVPEATDFTDYREIEGLRLPMRIVSRDEWNGAVVREITRVETKLSVEDDFFARTGPDDGDD